VVANSGTTAPLYSVYGLTGTDYWTVGGGGTILHTTNGTTWSPVASGTTADLYGTHSSTNNGGQVVRRMVGANGIRLGILGVGSTTVTVDNTPLGTSTLTAVIIRGGTNVQSYAVGLGGIFQNESSGTGWGAPTMVPGASDLYAVNTVGSDVWIVGQNGKAFRSQSGGAYQSIATGTTANLHAVDSTGGEVWAVGDNNTVIRYTGGASFTPVPGVNCPATSTNFLAVELEGTNNLWLVGDSGAVCWYNGTAWVNRSLHP
jgi:hypothetical protein